MKTQISTKKIFIAMPLVLGMLSLLSFMLYFYSANHAPYTYVGIIIVGPIFSFIGMIISIITRRSRKMYPTLWICGVISCIFGFIICILIFIILLLFIGAKLNE